VRAVVQRVTRGSVTVNEEIVGSINQGLVVLLGVGKEDSEEDARYLAEKTVNIRIFEDEAGKLNKSLLDIEGEVLAVSQFTLFGDCRKGRRPSFFEAASAENAEMLYEKYVKILRDYGVKVDTGRFQTMMMVEIYNDGPVTLLLDSKRQF
jgi:D-tyrosyl-tRNA(Tyr) deacylase